MQASHQVMYRLWSDAPRRDALKRQAATPFEHSSLAESQGERRAASRHRHFWSHGRPNRVDVQTCRVSVPRVLMVRARWRGRPNPPLTDPPRAAAPDRRLQQSATWSPSIGLSCLAFFLLGDDFLPSGLGGSCMASSPRRTRGPVSRPLSSARLRYRSCYEKSGTF
jgi:hypothetical protein